jgi:uncharacterized SAM-binding protein YcdF (DUF218 family)
MMSFKRKIFSPHKVKRPINVLIIIASISFSIWTCGFFMFIYVIPDKMIEIIQPTDAVVVLTGGSARLKRGLKILTKKQVKKLFVSGVYRGNDVKRLLEVQQQNPSEILCCINLGYEATSTAENAIETSGWIKENNYSSIQLVTANYHMPRSLMLFRAVMPNVKIIPHAVFPSQFKRNRWWTSPRTIALIFSEYSKYVIASISLELKSLMGSLKMGEK